jgi:hypothetical protein
MIKKLKRRFERVTVAWKMEFQSRGVLHFHMIVSLRKRKKIASYSAYEDGAIRPHVRRLGKMEGANANSSDGDFSGKGLGY